MVDITNVKIREVLECRGVNCFSICHICFNIAMLMPHTATVQCVSIFTAITDEQTDRQTDRHNQLFNAFAHVHLLETETDDNLHFWMSNNPR